MWNISNKIRDINHKINKSSHDFVQKHLRFLLQMNSTDLALDWLMHYKEIPPIYSKNIIEVIEFNSSKYLKTKYLEYLTMTYKISDNKFYTELTISYISMIVDLVNQKYEFNGEIDKDAIENDQEIWKLRK